MKLQEEQDQYVIQLNRRIQHEQLTEEKLLTVLCLS